MHSLDAYEFLVFDFEIVRPPPPPPSVPWITPLFDFHQWDFERQIGVRKHPSKVDQLVEEIEDLALFRAASSAQHTPPARILAHNPLAANDGLDDQDGMGLYELPDFVADGGERAVLNLDQLVTADHVDAELAKRRLELRVSVRIDFFELSMKRCFHRAAARREPAHPSEPRPPPGDHRTVISG